MKVHSAIARALAANNVDTVFSLVGDANLFIVKSLVEDCEVTHVSAAHESAATAMADGYARVTGRLGVATVTHGPGLTNTLTALVEAVKNRTPMLVVCGDTAAEDRFTGQDIPQRAVVEAIGAEFEPMRAPRTAAADVDRAIKRAWVERRPIVLNVPLDFQHLDVEDITIAPTAPDHDNQAVGPDPDALDRALGAVASSRRPIVLAGRGAIAARNELVVLAERLGAPLATTVKAKDLFRGEPFDLGIFGSLSTNVAGGVIAEADCVVSFGASLNRWTTMTGSLVEGKRVIHCDIDPSRFGNHTAIDVGVVGDAARVAATMVQWLDDAGLEISGVRTPELKHRLEDASAGDPFEDRSTAESIDLRSFLQAADRFLPENRAVIVDTGRFMPEPMKRLHVLDSREFVFASNFSAIGLATATAVGAAMARPSRPAVAVVGDGGFMLGGLGEFNAAVRHGADLIVIVCNDRSYGAEYMTLRAREMDVSLALLDWPEFAPLARALGGTGVTVRNPGDLAAAADAVTNRDRPLLIDVRLDPAAVPDVVGRPGR